MHVLAADLQQDAAECGAVSELYVQFGEADVVAGAADFEPQQLVRADPQLEDCATPLVLRRGVVDASPPAAAAGRGVPDLRERPVSGVKL